MRDPARIDEFCEWLCATWHKYPDWRFGQLISNFYNIKDNAKFFYTEDKELLDVIKNWYI